MSLISTKTTREGKPEIKSEGMGTLLDKNGLRYRIPPSLSVTTQRRLITNPSQSQTYSSKGHVNITLNSGDDYIWGKSSYMSFNLTASAASTFNSSALDIIKTLTIYHSSGTEIERLENVNLFRRSYDRYAYDQNYHDKKLSVAGYDPAVYGSNLSTYTEKFIVPLNHMSGLFDTNTLLPPYLMSGMRISIDLASNEEALKAAAATTYTISDVDIVLDSVTLADNVVKELNKTSASKGTELTWKSYEDTQKPESTQKLHISAERAVSRSNMAFMVARDLGNVQLQTADSLAPITYPVNQYQWRLGSSFFPNKKLDDKASMYKNAMYTFKSDGTVNYSDFKTDGADNSDGITTVLLERDDALDLSGLPVSSSRSLTLDATLDTPPASGYLINVFMTFEKVMRLFLYDKVQILE